MIDQDRKRLGECFREPGIIHDRTINPKLIDIFFNRLQKYTIEQVVYGFNKLAEESKFFPKPADVIEQIELGNSAHGGRVGPNEAWSIACNITDESCSAVVTKEILGAKDAAEGLDLIAGRMAFIEAYNRLCKQARDKGEPVKWFVSPGSDKLNLQYIVEAAVSKNLITQNYANKFLPGSTDQPQLTNLLESASKEAATNPHAKKALDDLHAMVEPKKPKVKQDNTAELEAELSQIKTDMRKAGY